MIIDIRNNETTVGERVDQESSLLVNFDSVKVSRFSGDSDLGRVPGEFSHPAELNLKLMDDWGIVTRPSTGARQGTLTPCFPALPRRGAVKTTLWGKPIPLRGVMIYRGFIGVDQRRP